MPQPLFHVLLTRDAFVPVSISLPLLPFFSSQQAFPLLLFAVFLFLPPPFFSAHRVAFFLLLIVGVLLPSALAQLIALVLSLQLLVAFSLLLLFEVAPIPIFSALLLVLVGFFLLPASSSLQLL